MTLFKTIHKVIETAVQDSLAKGALDLSGPMPSFVVEPPRERAHGDLATNVAMLLAKTAHKAPRAVAEILKPKLEGNPLVAGVEIAGPGFINLRLHPKVWQEEVSAILRTGTSYGESDIGKGIKVNVEYVSANPTGPMHVGHGRGAVVGDVLAALLEKAGYGVCREYYINDAGAQVDVLARSVFLRYREALGDNIGAIPEGLYPGDYLVPVGKALAECEGAAWKDKDEAEWLPFFRKEAIEAMMALIREDLRVMNVHHDVFFSERSLVDGGGVDAVRAFLESRDLVYEGLLEPPKGKLPDDWEPRPQLLFRATQFGDDVDRPLKKSDGSWTYFASDIAYHLNKFKRGFGLMIDVWGADHGGYVKRLQSAVKAVTDGAGRLEVRLCQMINLLKDGQPYKMSKRAGTFVTLRDLVDEVGADVVRFIMLTRKSDAPLDFDLVKALEQTRDNPIFYVQYAHARCCSVLRHAAEMFPEESLSEEALSEVSLDCLTSEEELFLIKGMANWTRVVEAAALAQEPHRIAFYLMDLAGLFHGLWNKGNDNAALRFIVPDDKNLTRARLALISATRVVLRSGLNMVGCTPMEELRSESPSEG
ncbi:MAG: arginine--tRNA ligase [Alphaproteobacteria bacterium]|nr:arginine--tRNA ligase [Alphaproteobacteria bacterium]